MSSLPYLTIVGKVAKVGCCITILTNSLVTYVTIFQIKKIAVEYKVLIVISTIFGALFSILEVIVRPFMHSFNGSYIYFSTTSFSNLPLSIKFCMLSLYSLAYMVIVFLLAIQFIYRYCVLLDNHYLEWFKSWKTLVWPLFGLFSSTIWTLSLWQCAPDFISIDYLRREMKGNYGLRVEELAGFHVLAYNPDGKLRQQTTLGILGCISILFILYSIIFYSGIRIHYGIKSLVSLISARNHRLHKQLFRTLVLQITIPTFVHSFPVFIVFHLPFLNLKLSFPTGIIVCFFNIYPALDSMVLMVMVAEYRVVLKKMLWRIVPCSCLANRIEPTASDEDDGGSTVERTN